MSEKGLIINSENGNEDLDLKRFHVALVYVRAIKGEEESLEIRHQLIEVRATDEGAAEWLGRKLSEADSQFPDGFIHNSSIAAEIV